MTSLKLDRRLTGKLEAASTLVREFRRIRVVSHYDADGISSASVLTSMLSRLGKQFHVTITNSLDAGIVGRLAGEHFDLFIFSDMGSGQLELLSKIEGKVIILDHHKCEQEKEREGLIHINPSLHGSNGTTEVCGSTTSYLLAEFTDEGNRDAIPLALAGAYGDMQHMGGFTGINRQILDLGIEGGYVQTVEDITLEGSTLMEAFTSSTQPYLKGYSGRPPLISGLFESIGVNPEKQLVEFSSDERRKVASLLMLMLASQGCDYEQVSQLMATEYVSTGRKMKISEIASLANACGRSSMFATGVAMELGDEESTRQARELRSSYTSRMFERLIMLEEGGVEHSEHLQYFRSDDASLSGALCGIYMSYIGDRNRPTVSFALSGDKYKISARGTKNLVKNGLDLASALSAAASKFGGNGGGHVIAAGATVPRDALSDFLKELDSIVGSQLSA